MNDFLSREILGNSIQDYLWVIGVILFVIFVARLISRYIAVFLGRIFRRSWKTFDEQKFVALIVHPLRTFLIISVIIISFYRLTFPVELNFTLYKYKLQQLVLSLAIAAQIISFTWLLLRCIDFIASVLEARTKRNADLTDTQLIVFFRDFLKVITGVIGVVMVLRFAFSYNVTSLLTGLSIVGAAIALSLRESLENLIASFVIFFDKPFTTGDFVKVQSISGNVEKIGLRSTRVRTSDKSYVTVPNKQMVDSILDNVSLRSQLRGELNLFIHLQTPPDKVQVLVEAIQLYLSGVPEIQARNVLFNDIRIQAFVIFIEFFTPPMDGAVFNGIRQSLNFFVLRKMDELGIRIATEGTKTGNE